MQNKILQGDALTKLKTLSEKSINMCMTSPPYWALRDYGTASWEGGDENCDHIEISSNIRDCSGGFSGRDKGTRGNQQSATTSKKQYIDLCKKCGAKRIDKQLGLEPTFDLYINNLCDIFDEVKRVLRDDGTCWVNLGDTYFGGGNNRGNNSPISEKQASNKGATGQVQQDWSKMDYKSKCLTMIPERFAIEMINRGWILRNKIIWYKPNAMPCSVKDRFTVDFEYLFFFSKKKKYYFKQQLEEYQSKPTHKLRDKSSEKYKGTNLFSKGGRDYYSNSGRNKRTTWSICPKPFKESHFAVYPEELCETPIKAGCPKGGVVLDPFFGAGTTGLVTLKQSKQFIGIELNPEYIKIAEKRLKPFLEQTTLNHSKSSKRRKTNE